METHATSKQYVCTRPALAGILMEKGYTATQTTNPYNPKRKAWIFDNADAGLSQVVTAYYTGIKEK